MKVRSSFITNSSSSSYIITGIEKLKAIPYRKLLEKARETFGEGESCDEFIADCRMLCGKGPCTCRSGDQSELCIDCGDTQYWDLSYGTFEDDGSEELLEKMGVKLTNAKSETYEVMSQIRDGTLNRLGALVVYDIPEGEFNRLQGKYNE